MQKYCFANASFSFELITRIANRYFYLLNTPPVDA